MAGKKDFTKATGVSALLEQVTDQSQIKGQLEMNAAGEVKEAEIPKEEGPKQAHTAKQKRNLINTSTGKPNKTARVNLALDPAVADALKQAAWEKHTSVNAYVEEILKRELNK